MSHVEYLQKVNTPQTAAADLSRRNEGIEASTQHRVAIGKTSGNVIG